MFNQLTSNAVPHIFVRAEMDGPTTVSVEPTIPGIDPKSFPNFDDAYRYADALSAEIAYYTSTCRSGFERSPEVTVGTTYTFSN